MIVAIHQPNYLPWLGYFFKIARAEAFVFLDDVQFSKGSYTNRVQLLDAGGRLHWLTVPVSVALGDAVAAVRPARPDWPARHWDTIKGFYRQAPAFAAVAPRIRTWFAELDGTAPLSETNQVLIRAIAEALGFGCRFVRSSVLAVPKPAATDDRLVHLTKALSPSATYLSGKGGAKYQNPEKFAAAGLGFRYSAFSHPRYDQGGDAFVAGLSVLDVLFRFGWRETHDLIESSGGI